MLTLLARAGAALLTLTVAGGLVALSPAPAAHAAGATVSGVLTAASNGAPQQYLDVTLIEVADPYGPSRQDVVTQADGSYTFSDVAPGTYVVCAELQFLSNAEFIAKCWGDETVAGGAPIVVATDPVPGISFALLRYSTISGTVTWTTRDGAGNPVSTQPLPNANVSIAPAAGVLPTSFGDNYPWTWTDNNGDFTIKYVVPGDYALQVRFDYEEPWLNIEYWDDALFAQAGEVITIDGDDAITLDSIDLDERSLFYGRIAGPDRFATAVAIAQNAFPEDNPDVPVVYIANGLNYPDALAAGPVAIEEGGVMLTVPPTSLPSVVATELARLSPDRVVIVGGEPSVSTTVRNQIAAIVGSANVSRIGGSDRFATGRLLVESAFTTSDYLYIATGLNYPDALSAGPAAGLRGAPVLLVNGGASGLDAASLELIESLAPTSIRIVGATASVSAGIEADLMAYKAARAEQSVYVDVFRFAGMDRYATSYLINQDAFGRTDVVFVSLGTNFADALTGGPLAGKWGSPLYLTQSNCLMPFIPDVMVDYKANLMAILGSEASLGPGVEFQTPCSIPWTP
ncbi:cell wall-binding repeat-containing protein [Schumannella luteola]